MGKSVNMNNLSPEEAEQILKVIQKDFELRQKEKERLSKIEEVINEEESKTELLTKQEKFNEKCCIRCCQTFGIIFNRKQICQFCKLFVCKSCANYDDKIKGYICKACLTELELKHKSLDWFYNNVSKRYKRFGSAKVVQTLYKQTDGARTHHFHSDNESDSGYNPLLFPSFSQSGSLPAKTRPSLITLFPQVDDHEDKEIDNALFQPPPILPPILPNQTASSTVSNGNVHKDDDNMDNISPSTSLESIQMSTQTIPTAASRKTATPTQTNENVGSKELDKKDIYREALENTKRNEEAKFKVQFESLLQEMQQSFENLSPQDGRVPSSYGNSLCGDLMTKYRSHVKDLLFSLSQRLELAVESFDETCANNPSLTSQKVRRMISKLVKDHLGESLDLTSDEAVSDLSSLSDDSAAEQTSMKDQIAQAIIARVLEICQNQNNVHLDLKESIDNDTTDSFGSEIKHEAGSGNSLFTEERDLAESSLSYVNLDNTNQNVPKMRNDKNEEHVLPKLSSNIGTVNNTYHQCTDDVSNDKSESIGHYDDADGEIRTTFEHDLRNSDNIKCQKPEQKNHSETAYELHAQTKFDADDSQEVDKAPESVDESVNVKMELEKLRSFARDVLLKPLHEEYNVTEEVEPEPIEEIMECIRFDHASSQMEFHNRIATFEKVHDSEHHGLPDFSDLECEYHNIGVNEIDPDLLSMNLTSIAEETEEELVEEGEESEESETETHVHDWRGNWLFKGAQGLAAYNKIVESKEFGDGFVMVPQLNTIYAPLIGNIDVDDMSDMSENENRDLNDEDSTFYPKTSEEIARIAHQSKHPTHGSALANISVQTEADSLISCPNSSFSDSVSHGSRREQRSFDSYTSEKSLPKLSEDLIPAEGDDPRFEILPESVTVAEGEPAKLTLTVTGSQAIDVFWYKFRGEVEELSNSENYDITKNGCKHELTMYNTRAEEAGQYMCMAINDKGQCSKYFVLTIKKNSQELKKPEFLKTLQDVEVKEGQSVKFRCKVKGYPQARIIWYKDGYIIQNQPKYTLERFGNRDYILAIDSVTMDDDAEYSVLARNVAGDVRSSAQLIVEPRGTPEKVSVTDKKSSKTTNAEMEHKSYNFLDLSYLPLQRAKESKVLQLSTHTDISEEHKQSKESSTKSARNNGDMPRLIQKVLMTQDSVSNLAEDLQTSSKMTNAAEKGQQLTSPYMDYFHNQEIVFREKSQGATTSTPRSSDTDHIFNPESEGIYMTCDNTVVIQSDISTETPQDMSTNSHTTELLDNVNLTLVTTDVEKNIYSKSDMKVTLGERSHVMSAAITEIETMESLGHTDSHGVSPVFSMDVSHTTNSTNSSFEAPAVSNMSPGHTIQTQIVNLGPKRECKDPYRKYFYVTDTPKMKRKTPESSPREDKEAAHTEEKRRDVKDSFSDLAYQQKPATMSENLSPHLPVSPEREKLEPTCLKGVTSEQDLPECRAEFNDEFGLIELPSVNQLKVIFGGNMVAEKDVTLRRVNTDTTSQDAVHSITARSVPKEQLARLRNTFHQNSVSISKDHNPGRATALLTGQQIKLRPVTPTEVYKSHNFKSSEEQTVQSQVPHHQSMYVSSNVKIVNVDTSDIKSKQPINLHLSSGNTNRPISSAIIGQSRTTQPSKSLLPAGADALKSSMQSDSSKPNLKTVNKTDNNPKGIKPLRIKTGAISAMSKFWEKRLSDSVVDENAPNILEYD